MEPAVPLQSPCSLVHVKSIFFLTAVICISTFIFTFKCIFNVFCDSRFLLISTWFQDQLSEEYIIGLSHILCDNYFNKELQTSAVSLFLPKVFLKVVILAATWMVAIDTETIFTFSDALVFYSFCDKPCLVVAGLIQIACWQ